MFTGVNKPGTVNGIITAGTGAQFGEYAQQPYRESFFSSKSGDLNTENSAVSIIVSPSSGVKPYGVLSRNIS